jgi:hypothetical protein
MRKTSDPNVIHPDDLYTRAERIRLADIADLEEQIETINRELQRFDDVYSGADMAGDYAQCASIETQVDHLIGLQDKLRGKVNSLRTPD